MPAAKSVGKSLLRTGLKKGSGILHGLSEGKNLSDAVKAEFIGRQIEKAPEPRKSRSVQKRPAISKNRKRKAKRSNQAAKRARVNDIFG